MHCHRILILQMSVTMLGANGTGAVRALIEKFEHRRYSDCRISNTSSDPVRCSTVASLKGKYEGRLSNSSAGRGSDSHAANPQKMRVYNFSDLLALEASKETCHDLDSLRLVIQQAKHARLPQHKIKEFELLLHDAEAGKMELELAVAKSTIQHLEDALRRASAFLRQEPTFVHAQHHLRKLLAERTAKTQLLLVECIDRVRTAMTASGEDTLCGSFLDVLEDLSVATELGKAHGVESALLDSANEVTTKAKNKLRLQAAMERADIEELQQAVQEAYELRSEDLIVGRAEDRLRTLVAERVANTRSLLRERMLQVSTEATNEVCSRKAVQELRAAIRLGEEHDVEENMISSAHELLSQAVSTGILQCGVCLQSENDVYPMSCCGRAESSNVLCGECMSDLLGRGARCPFCRARSTFR